MTKRELLDKLADVPDDFDIVMADGLPVVDIDVDRAGRVYLIDSDEPED